MTTFSLDEFNQLVEKLEPEWHKREEIRLLSRKRKNRIGQGRPYALGDFPHLVLVTILFLRTPASYELLGLLAGVDQSTIKRTVRKILPLLQDRFIPKTDITRGKRRTNNLDEFLKEYPELKDIVCDGTEMAIKRPKKRQKQSYSGKKKRHTKKVQIALNKKDKLIIGVSPPKNGSMHDKKQLEKTPWESKLDPSVSRMGELGYLGMEDWKIPHKKPKGGTLTQQQKHENRRLSKERIVVEHAIRGMKMFRRIGETITATTDDFLYTTVLATANLYNFKRLVRQGLG